MTYLFSAAAGLIAGIAAVLLIERSRERKRRRKKRTARKFEFSKLILSGVLLTYLPGSAWGFGPLSSTFHNLGFSSHTWERRRQRQSGSIRGKQRRKTS